MRLVSYATPNGPSFGLVVNDGVVDLARRTKYSSIRSVLADGRLSSLAAFESQAADHRLAEITFLPTIPDATKILCVGLNYHAHVTEGGPRDVPKYPRLFSRFVDSLVGHGQPVTRPHVSIQFDYEGEFAVIIGREGRYIPADKAMDYVAGYTGFNDGSIRDYQQHMTTAGKNFWHSGAMGPWMVTADELPGQPGLTLTTKVNGEERQRTKTDTLIYSIPTLIEYASKITPLAPGDVIATGTPAGVALHRNPPAWLKAGDLVEVEIAGIGILRNAVIDEKVK
jgi:2-keto-4-pentenoate hydratase/2-oxohepta-3-ene-1,7-dioic acid hydratase in catechol pathway